MLASLTHPNLVIARGQTASAVMGLGGTSTAEITLEDGANFTLYQILRDNTEPTRVRVTQKRDSSFNIVTVMCGTQNQKSFFEANLSEPGASLDFAGLAVVGANSKIEQETLISHTAPNTTSTQIWKSVVQDHGKSAFVGRVVIAQHAQKSSAQQQTRGLLLSKNAEANARPELEIFADDVKCAHGAAIGRLSLDELFYLQSRGLTAEQATALLVSAFARDVLRRLPEQNLRDELDASVHKLLASAERSVS